MKPKLTIAIPNYNGGENLRRAIRSCSTIDLNSDEFEILVIDNKSTDKSIEIVNELKIKIPNIKLWQNEKNVGRIQNWNICLRKAKGDYLILLFTNDLINEDNNISEVIKILDDEYLELFNTKSFLGLLF